MWQVFALAGQKILQSQQKQVQDRKNEKANYRRLAVEKLNKLAEEGNQSDTMKRQSQPMGRFGSFREY